MTKVTSKGQHLIGGLLTVLESEPMAIMVGSMVADRQTGRQGAGAVAKSLHHIHKVEMWGGKKMVLVWTFETSKPTPMPHLPQGPTS